MKELLFGGLKMGYLRELNLVSILFRIFLSVMIGGFLGVERGKMNRPAGLRTDFLGGLVSGPGMMAEQ